MRTFSRLYTLLIPCIMTNNLQQATNKVNTISHLHIHKYIKTVQILFISNVIGSSSGTDYIKQFFNNTSNNICTGSKHIFCELYRCICSIQFCEPYRCICFIQFFLDVLKLVNIPCLWGTQK